MDEIIIKTAEKNILKELNSIGFDADYAGAAQYKYRGCAYKIFNLKPYEANILKQLCLSAGFDCAVSRDTVTCGCAKTDALIFASQAQYNHLIEKLKLQPFRLKELSKKLEKVFNTPLEPLKTFNGAILDWNRPYIAGILNVTPDSFSDGGKFLNPDAALRHALQMIEDGADIIDAGAQSTRPGAEHVSADKEIKRVIPVIKLIRKHNQQIPISIDTVNHETAAAAVDAGADIINDVSGFDYDYRLFEFAAENNIPSIIMHSDKIPAVSSDFAKGNLIEEIYISLYKKIEKLKTAGMARKNIIIDPGIGFGKSETGCFEILKRLNEFTSLNAPVMLGISRKSFIRNAFNLNTDEADIPTAFYCAAAENVNIHRVHNVKLTKRFLDYKMKTL